MDSKLKCSFEMPTTEQLMESKNIHEDVTVNILSIIYKFLFNLKKLFRLC